MHFHGLPAGAEVTGERLPFAFFNVENGEDRLHQPTFLFDRFIVGCEAEGQMALNPAAEPNFASSEMEAPAAG